MELAKQGLQRDKVGGPAETKYEDYAMAKFMVNQRVRIKGENPGPNRRVPQYARGKTGVIVAVHGESSNYSHDHADDWGPLYSVVLDDDASNGFQESKIVIDIHEPWLESVL